MEYAYKGFETNIKFSEEDGVYFGKVENITDLVSFHGETIEECLNSFHEAVEDYVDFCKKN